MGTVKILHLTFNMGIGGTEQVIRQIINTTSDVIHHEIFCIDGEVGEIGNQLRQNGVNIVSHKRGPGLDFRLIKHIRSYLIDGEFDVVHCHQYTPYIYGFLSSFGTRARLVFTEHGRFYPDRYRYKGIFINPLIALLTPAIVAISHATKAALVKYEFMPSRKIKVIYNGIEGLSKDSDKVRRVRESLGIPLDGFVVGTVSRLDPVKNQVLMVEAFKRFLERYPDSWLLMVGDGPDREKLEDLTRKLKISSRVIFTGFITKPVDFLSSMDVFMLSSHTEGTSMTLLEAMSLGIPALVTDVGGNPEIVVNDESGLLSPAGSVDDFYNALCSLRNPELAKRLAQNAKERFRQKFSAKSMSDQYRELYRKLSDS